MDRARSNEPRPGPGASGGRANRRQQQGADPPRFHRAAAGSAHDRNSCNGLRRLRRGRMRRAGDRRLECAGIRDQHSSGTHFRADPGAAARIGGLPAGRDRRSLAEGRTVLLLLPSHQRPRGVDARHHRRRRHRPECRAARASVRHAHAVRRAQECRRSGTPLHAFRRGHCHVRCHHAALSADARDPRYDCRA